MKIDPDNSLQRLGEEMSAAITLSSNSFSAIFDPEESPGWIALSLMRECEVHVIAFGTVANHAREGLLIWKLQHAADQLSEVEQAQWKIAFQSVQLLVRAIEIDRTREYLDLLKETSISLGNLVGTVFQPFGLIKELTEIADKLLDLNKVSRTNLEVFRNTGTLLTRWELYMMRGLLACQYAIVSTDSLLHPLGVDTLGIPLEELANTAMLKARRFVRAVVADSRQDNGINLPVVFPRDGMWPAIKRPGSAAAQEV